MKKNHKFFSNLAFNLAEKNLGHTKMNPSVGCVVVKNNAVISSGVTSLNGRPHAEHNALNKKINFKDSSIYVTLEPCTHYGETPPCTKIIKKKGVKNVYYSFNDPDIRTHKKARYVLKKNKINFKKITLKNNSFYESYFLNRLKKIPLVDAKIAISKDNFTINRKSKWITNARSRLVGHLIRSKYDSIISTSKSINKDNSLLNCRIDGLNNNKPDLIIIDRGLKLKRNLKLLNFSKTRKTYIITTVKNKKKKLFYTKKNIKIITLKSLSDTKDFKILFDMIYKIGKRRVLIESGLIFLKELINKNFINNLYVFRSNKKLKKYGLNNTKFIKFTKIKNNCEIKVDLEDDKLFRIKIK